MPIPVAIQPFTKIDWPVIAAIYKEGIATGIATFETKVPRWEDWDAAHIQSCRIAALYKNKIVGWAALSPVSKREVYKGVAEVSIYITSKFRGKVIGRLLLSTLIAQSEQNGFWTLQAGIFRENNKSITLHTDLGFRKIGYREKVGKLNQVWYDNILLEKRSKKINNHINITHP